MLTELCNELNNWFVPRECDRHIGRFVIKDGAFTPPFELADGRFYRIIGSAFNDGVHIRGEEGLTDEEFEGAVWVMSVPRDVLELSKAIDEFNEKNQASPYISESFGGYSYSKATGKNGNPATWQDVFKPQLNRWRKL